MTRNRVSASANAQGPKLYKVLVNGGSCHGGSLTWDLPKGNKPGDWQTVTGELSMCGNGLHLTREPSRWWLTGADCYEAEYTGEIIDTGDEKVCVHSARLVRQVPWADVNVFSEGEHTVTNAHAVALGSSSVEAWGSSSVVAWGSSSVVARESSRVEAWGSSRVEARGSSSVVARGSSRVEAWGSSRVEARGSSSVVARESSRVEAWGSSNLIREGGSWYRHIGRVTLCDNAACIDRRDGAPKLYAAPWSDLPTEARL